MAISNCSKCGKAYDFWSEEAANEPDRLCKDCYHKEEWVMSTGLSEAFSQPPTKETVVDDII